jgi:sugar phosphate isomerase/epimerase
MQINGHDLGVCSWSVRPANMQELVSALRQLELSHLQLALGPLLFLDDKRKYEELGHLRASHLKITAGMIAFPGEDYSTIARIRATGGVIPDESWPVRKQLAIQAGKLAQELGLSLLTGHAGFIPPSNHAQYSKALERVGEIGHALKEMNVALALETGQESASELLQFLNDLPGSNVGVNFDPGNMILYGSGDPIEAIRILSRHIRHVHVKDAVASAKPGLEWGKEVPVGTGQLNLEQFILALKDIAYTGPLVIEREAGPNRMNDIRTAVAALSKFDKL